MIPKLPQKLSDKLDKIAEKGNVLEKKGKPDKAIAVWEKGLKLIPEPQNIYEEAVWFLTAIGDVYFMKGEFLKSYEYFNKAIVNLSGDGARNPFVLMRFGECCFELEDEKNAVEYLLKAYMLEGESIFAENENKYLDFLKANVELNDNKK